RRVLLARAELVEVVEGGDVLERVRLLVERARPPGNILQAVALGRQHRGEALRRQTGDQAERDSTLHDLSPPDEDLFRSDLGRFDPLIDPAHRDPPYAKAIRAVTGRLRSARHPARTAVRAAARLRYTIKLETHLSPRPGRSSRPKIP